MHLHLAPHGLFALMALTVFIGPFRTAPSSRTADGGPVARARVAAHRTKVAKPAKRHRAARAPRPRSIAYRSQYVRGRRVHVVQVDLSQPDVKLGVATAAGGIGSRDTWAEILRRTRPTAAITGTYFDVATAVPVGTIMTGGVIIHRGSVGSSLAIRPDNQVEFAYHRPNGSILQWDGFETVLRAGPRLVVEGQVRLVPAWEGFRDPAVYARKSRAAVGLTRHRKLLLVTVPGRVLLRQLAAIMRDLGAVEAICMDGGSSAGLYYRGKSFQVPRRSLTNLLVVYEDTERYRQVAAQLAPGVAVGIDPSAGSA